MKIRGKSKKFSKQEVLNLKHWNEKAKERYYSYVIIKHQYSSQTRWLVLELLGNLNKVQTICRKIFELVLEI